MFSVIFSVFLIDSSCIRIRRNGAKEGETGWESSCRRGRGEGGNAVHQEEDFTPASISDKGGPQRRGYRGWIEARSLEGDLGGTLGLNEGTYYGDKQVRDLLQHILQGICSSLEPSSLGTIIWSKDTG